MMASLRRRADASSKVTALRRIPGLEGRDDRELAELARHLDEATVQAGRVLTEEGMPGREAFLVVDGHAEVRIRGELVATVGPGDFVGEMALLDRRLRSATVTATTPMTLMVAGPQAFDDLASTGAVSRLLVRELVERLRDADDRIAETDARKRA